jgi:hypothetical protein
MTIFQLFNELDELIMLQYGELEVALQTERGKQLVKMLLSEENRAQLRQWYNSRPNLNSGAMEMKRKLEKELGEEL